MSLKHEFHTTNIRKVYSYKLYTIKVKFNNIYIYIYISVSKRFSTLSDT